MLRWILGGLMMLSVAACDNAKDLQNAPAPLGDFSLLHNIVVAPKVGKVPGSRNATEEELTTAMKAAIAERFDRYEGEKIYHFGVSVEGYLLAPPGIPILFAPKSIMTINLTVWDNKANAKLNAEPHQITVFESFGKGPIVGTGYTQTAEQQLENLAQNASKAIERYLVKQQREEGWFTGE